MYKFVRKRTPLFFITAGTYLNKRMLSVRKKYCKPTNASCFAWEITFLVLVPLLREEACTICFFRSSREMLLSTTKIMRLRFRYTPLSSEWLFVLAYTSTVLSRWACCGARQDTHRRQWEFYLCLLVGCHDTSHRKCIERLEVPIRLVGL